MTWDAALPQKILRPAASLEDMRLAVITVTFHPDIEKLKLQLEALPREATSVIVDNASNEDEIAAIKRLAMERAGTHLIQNDQNVGLATAVNRGATYVAELSPAHDFLLLMDQDSQPRPFSIENLMAAFLQLEDDGHQVGCVGPRLVDETTGLQHGFHCIYGWRWVRIFPPLESMKPVSCTNLNGGGTLVRTPLFGKLGGLDETLFIDHVDTEWAFRVLAAGYGLFGIPHAIFDHGMGERGLRFWWFGWRVWPQRSPRRHYYLFRNAIFDPRRGGQISNMVSGIRDAFRRSFDK